MAENRRKISLIKDEYELISKTFVRPIMRPENKRGTITVSPIHPSEPTIWALRKPLPQDKQQTSRDNGGVQGGSLYEHLFGYDPIRIGNVVAGQPMAEIQRGSADNPKLNIITPKTNFLVKTLTSDSQ